jgi:hypothetical protein
VPDWFLNTYRPLVATKHGRAASNQHGILPFVDGSIRREPDLEHVFPTISCLCRAGKFASRLRVGDTVAYLTVKSKYGDVGFRHRRLTAVLRVGLTFQSHLEAARWFVKHGVGLPGNCMVDENAPLPIERSNRYHKWARELDDLHTRVSASRFRRCT